MFDRKHIGCGGVMVFVEATEYCDVYFCRKCKRHVKVINCLSFYDYHPELDPYRRKKVAA